MKDVPPISARQFQAEIILTIFECNFSTQMIGLLLAFAASMPGYDHLWAPQGGYCFRESGSNVDRPLECARTCAQSGETIRCINLPTYHFCHDVRSYFFMIWFPFAAVIFACQVISILRSPTFMPPFVNFLHNYFVTACWCLMICGFYCAATDNSDDRFLGIVVILFPIILIVQWLCIFVCMGAPCFINPLNSGQRVISVMMREPLPLHSLTQSLKSVRGTAPSIRLEGTEMVNITRNRVLTQPYRQSEPLAYVSWEERADGLTLPYNSAVSLEVTVKFEYTESLAATINGRMESFREEMLAHSQNQMVSVQFVEEVPGAPECVLGYTGDSIPPFHRWVAQNGRTWWIALGVFGLHSVFETIYCLMTKSFEFQSVKWLSDKQGLHAAAGQFDDMAPAVEPSEIFV
jgi:hypothetical protein